MNKCLIDSFDMSYHIDLDNVPLAHAAPALLGAFAAWLATQEHGSVGWFDALRVAEIPATWDEANAARLQREALSFLDLPDGSLLALIETGVKDAPRAVVLLGSEGEARTVATSLEAFLLAWSEGESEIAELDDDEASAGRPAMKAWLTTAKVRAPKAPNFDFQAWLDEAEGGVASAPSAIEQQRPAPAIFATFLLPFRRLAELSGQRADDPKVIDFVIGMGGKVPTSTTDMSSSKEVKSKTGFTLWFSHDHLNDAFPLLPKTKNSFVPYVSQVQLSAKWPEKLPFDLNWKHDQAAIETRLGPPIVRPLFADDADSPILTWWERDLDPGRTYLKVQLKKKGLSVDLLIRGTFALSSRHGVPAKPVVGLVVAWALSRGLLDESRFPKEYALLARIKQRAEKGSALIDAAMPRGLWCDHLLPDEALRTVASNLFGGMGGLSLDQDLIDVFGERTNIYSHREPVIDDDSWDAVDKAAKILDQRFAAFVKK